MAAAGRIVARTIHAHARCPDPRCAPRLTAWTSVPHMNEKATLCPGATEPHPWYQCCRRRAVARDNLPQAHAVWRRPSGWSGASAAANHPPVITCFRRSLGAHGASDPPPRGKPTATRQPHGAHAEAAPRAGAPCRQLAAAAPGRGMQHGGGRPAGDSSKRPQVSISVITSTLCSWR